MSQTSGVFQNLLSLLEGGQLICSDKYLELCAAGHSLKYLKRDFLYKSGDWRGSRNRSLISQFGDLLGSTLLIGHSDISTNCLDLRVIRSLGIKRVFGINTITRNEFSETLPLGLTNPTHESDLHRLFGNTSHLGNANSTSNFVSIFSGTVYCNFTLSNNLKERKGILDLISSSKSSLRLLKDEMDFSEEGRIRYLVNCRESDMVACPEGNGFDTHRFWETIYMGGVPVVTKNKVLNGLFEGLPVIVLQNWEELHDSEKIEEKWNLAREKIWDASLLTIDYWKERISGNHDIC